MEENTAMTMEEEMVAEHISDILTGTDLEESENEEYTEIGAAPLVLGGLAIGGIITGAVLLLSEKGKEKVHDGVIKAKAKIRMRKDDRKLMKEERKKKEDAEINAMIEKLKEAAKSKESKKK